ncbi:hypothetical protein FQA47_018306, partial [Oryzias melastigma]
MHWPRSLAVLSSPNLVSNRPGVSMTDTCCPSTTPLPLEQSTVRDLALHLDWKHPRPRMVFPVALFPIPVFPTITILSSLLLVMKEPEDKNHI